MATLVLTAVGTAVGGPIGGAIGSVLGQAVDQRVFAPKRREGPRLTELRLQTSSYGTQLPKLFGTVRVAGTVIWATDLIESRSTGGAGKGQPSVSQYSYSASFAVLLSARAIRGVRRIWAEGKLLRGAAGDWKAQTGFRLHPGGEDQAPDPLIASAVGPGLAPAHRGCAYSVFEGMQLADYGNRIPSLTFEVVADDRPITAGDMARELAAEVDGDAGPAIGGFAAAGGSVGAVLDTLARIGGGWWAVDGGRVVLRGREGQTVPIADAGVAADGRGGTPRTRTTAPLSGVPAVLSVSHYDPARDYQTGVQRARRLGAGWREDRIDVPAVVTAGEAKAMAEAMLLRAEAERVQRVVTLGLEGLAIGPGERVTVEGEPGVWRVAGVGVEAMVTRLALVPLPGPGGSSTSADSGQVVGAEDAVVGPTMLAAFETPGLDDVPLGQPRLTVVAAGGGAGWKRAALLYSLDDGASWLAAGSTGGPGVIGTLVTAPRPGPATLLDLATAVEVDLAHDAMMLADADDRQLDAGANLAVLGDELIQFGRAEPLGGARWRLSRLLRGRRGTEAAIGRQADGDRFVLLQADAARTIDLPLAAIGSTVRVMASGVGDLSGPALAEAAITGASVLPPAPVGLAGRRDPDGSVHLTWIRRSRAGWRWIDGADVPLVEEVERYRLVVTRADGSAAQWETSGPSLTLTADEIGRGPARVAVRPRGTHGESAGAELII